jgi:hypothetical protein
MQVVEFRGLGGNIDFKYFNGPSPGKTGASLQRLNMASELAPHTSLGIFLLPDDLLLLHRVFHRDNYVDCAPMLNSVAPGRICPPNTSIEWSLEEGNDNGIP